jgi:hypothetical protein
MAERACALTGNSDPKKLKTLAAAYAESGRFVEAVKSVQTAEDLAAHGKQSDLAGQCAAMLQFFQQSKPWRE